MRKIIGLFLILLGVGIFLFVNYRNSEVSSVNRPFSTYSIHNSSWENYKKQFINPDGRVIDYSQNDITTSEGQSYAMLRAVWIDDKATFDQVWKWTRETLKRPDDNLFGWRWGNLENENYGFIADGGINSASDADTDIALALLFAGKRWGDNTYTDQAKVILKDVWEIETDTIADKRYLVAGNWAKGQDRVIINPSYFSPYAWRIFGQVDTERDWLSLIDPGYELLFRVSQEKIDKGQSVGLPPDWIALRRDNSQIDPANLGNFKTDYFFDGMRVPFRIGLDLHWYNEPRAAEYLKTSFKFLEQEYQQKGKILSGYTHDGVAVVDYETPSMYATSLGYFVNNNPDLAKRIYDDKIIKLYSTDLETFRQDLPYYDQNWLWFGAAYYHKALNNFF